MAKFTFQETIQQGDVITARLGAGTGSSNHLKDTEVGKFVKFAGDSRYNLAAAGDLIEGRIVGVEKATLDDYSIGSVAKKGGNTLRFEVTLDGLQATPGTGAIAIGDYVVVGTVVAKDTALSGPAKVCKATVQPGVSVPADAAAAGLQVQYAKHLWKLVSATGTAVGSIGVIEAEV
jgi:hypothetical protein